MASLEVGGSDELRLRECEKYLRCGFMRQADAPLSKFVIGFPVLILLVSSGVCWGVLGMGCHEEG